MAKLTIIEHPDPRLRQVAKPVVAFDAELQRLVADMFDTLYAANAIGLAAPQVGVSRELAVIDVSGDRSAPHVFINPRINARAGLGLVEESCLSVPGISGTVKRALQVQVDAHHVDGSAFTRELDGMLAVCLQHEMDHFAGTLFVDRLGLLRRLMFRISAPKLRAATPD
jgi:peptide deformylase